MTDFAKLTGAPVAIDESLEAFKFTPDGFQNGKGKPLELTMHPVGGTRFKKSARKMQIKAARSQQEAPKDGDMTEEDLDAAMIEADDRSAELMARCCDGWNMTDGEKPMPFNIENATALFTAIEALRTATDEAITARGKSLMAKKGA